ncbi:MAG: PIN domain-containing protein [Bacteroidales bacterium]|jgi:predicted nucleic acid-binding protein|nr:PIN domain-containing protein [Bacteroidales bacterium]
MKTLLFFCSIIAKIELLAYNKLSQEQEFKILELLKCFHDLFLDEEIVSMTVQIRRKYTSLKLPDAITAASALAVGATLLTNDKQLIRFNWPELKISSFF